MDNPSGGGTPTQPSSEPRGPEPQFTVPVPTHATPTQALPVTAPPPTGAPWRTEVPVPSGGAGPVSTMPYAAHPLPAEAPSDAESLRSLALVLLGVAVGFWVFVGIRMLALLVDSGFSPRLLIETIDQTSVETIAAALIAVLGLASAVASRAVASRAVASRVASTAGSGRGASSVLVSGAGAVALATVVAAIWRLI